MSETQIKELLSILENRFNKNLNRHEKISWKRVQKKLEENPEKLKILNEMEKSGGEPDIVDLNEKTGEYIFFDCSKESPIERRNLCYDNEALEARKKFKPKDSAVNVAKAMGIELLTEEQYKFLQGLGEFDLKTSSWLKTPEAVRKLGGAIFADRRYDRVFIYHNGADSYYGVRGFRGLIKI